MNKLGVSQASFWNIHRMLIKMFHANKLSKQRLKHSEIGANIYSTSSLIFLKTRHTFMWRTISERVGGKLLTVSSLGSEAWELKGEKKSIFLLFLYHPILFDSLPVIL